jgi:hypothetical protein
MNRIPNNIRLFSISDNRFHPPTADETEIGGHDSVSAKHYHHNAVA